MNARDKHEQNALNYTYPVDFRGYSEFSQPGSLSVCRPKPDALAALERLVLAARDGEALEQFDLEPGNRND